MKNRYFIRWGKPDPVYLQDHDTLIHIGPGGTTIFNTATKEFFEVGEAPVDPVKALGRPGCEVEEIDKGVWSAWTKGQRPRFSARMVRWILRLIGKKQAPYHGPPLAPPTTIQIAGSIDDYLAQDGTPNAGRTYDRDR